MVELAGGERLRYDDLLIATGSEPVRLPALAGFGNVQALRTFDGRRAPAGGAVAAGARVSVVGGGLIGLEVASSARRLGVEVTVIEAAPVLLPRLGPFVGSHLAALHRADGDGRCMSALRLLSVRGGTAGIEEGGSVGGGGRRVEELVLADGTRVATDHVVEAVGVRPASRVVRGRGGSTRTSTSRAT